MYMFNGGCRWTQTKLKASQNTLVAPDVLPPPLSSPKTRALEAISKKHETLSPEAMAVLISRLQAFTDETPIVILYAPSAVPNPRVSLLDRKKSQISAQGVNLR